MDSISRTQRSIPSGGSCLSTSFEQVWPNVSLFQQKVYWQTHNVDIDPIAKFTDDLAAEVAVWLAAGDQVVLGLDVNEDLRSGVFQRAMEHVGLVGPITKQHGPDGPPTYIIGSVPIDKCFVSPGLDSLRCGYFPMQFDHHSLWVDIPYCLAFFGCDIPPIVRPQARCLKVGDPRIVKKYGELYDAYLLKHDIYKKGVSLEAAGVGDMSLGMLYNEMDAVRCLGMKYAEQNCRKLQCGQVNWTPEWQQNTMALSSGIFVYGSWMGIRSNPRFSSEQPPLLA
jgi:hypothetical protein